MEKVAVIIDSAVDLPPTVEKANDIRVVPMGIQMSGVMYRERLELSRDEFFKRLKRQPDIALKTSPPTPADFQQVFMETLRQGKTVMLFTLSSLLSGTFANAAAAKRFFSAAEQERIHLFDTHNISAGSGLLVLKALEMLQEGCTVSGILERLTKLRDRVVSLAYVESLEYTLRGGRFSFPPQKLAKWFAIKPLIRFRYGVLQKACYLFGPKEKERKMIRCFLRKIRRNRAYNVGIVYSDDSKSADLIEEWVKAGDIQLSYYYKVQGSAVIGSHAGPGSYAVYALPDS